MKSRKHQSHSTTDPIQISDMSNYMPPIKPRLIAKGLFKLIILLVVIGAAVGGVFFLVSQHKTTKPVAKAAQTTKAVSNSDVTQITTATKHYDSSNFGLGINYPEDWAVNDSDTVGLTITSPTVQLKNAQDQVVAGRIVLTIQNQQSTISQFVAGTAIASIASQKVSYKNPTPDQRAQTYVSFVSYSGAPDALDALYITGDNGYVIGQSIPQSDVIQDDPLIMVSFLKCADSACTAAGTALSLSTTSWSSTSLSGPILQMLESLAID